MSEKWHKNEHVEKAFEDMYKVKTEIHRWGNVCDKCGSFLLKGDNKVKFINKDKEIVLTEKLKDGLTDIVILEYDDKTELFSTVKKAEERVIEILGK